MGRRQVHEMIDAHAEILKLGTIPFKIIVDNTHYAMIRELVSFSYINEWKFLGMKVEHDEDFSGFRICCKDGVIDEE